MRWFFLVFAVFMLVTAPLQIPFSSPVPAAGWPSVVPALGFLLWRRIREYRLGELLPPHWDVVEALAVFVALLDVGPLSGGLGLLYAGVYFRTVFGSAPRVVMSCLTYLLALIASSWYADQLSPFTGTPWLQQVVVNVAGLLLSTFLLRLVFTTLVAHQRALAEKEKLLSTVLDNIDTSVIAFSSAGLPVLRNRAALNLYAELSLPEPPQLWHEGLTLYRRDGCTPMPVEDLPMWQVLRGQGVREQELTLGLPDGSYRSYVCSGQSLPSDDIGQASGVLTLTDVTAHKQAEDRLSHLALHDPLTGLSNRVLLRDRLEHALQRPSARYGQTHVLFIDLDGFKTVNDSLGHAVGDQVLMTVAERLRSTVRDVDTAARLGGDEFAVLLEEEPQDVAVAAGERILTVLREPLVVKGRATVITASIGVASSRGPGNAEELLRNADLAMYIAKEQGDRVATFEPAMHSSAMERLTLEADLRTALERHELFLEYQPVISLRTGQMTGVEALVRWRHPTRGLISPADFIPLAESSGLIINLGAWVLGEACRQLREWRDASPAAFEGFSMAVNVAVHQLERAGLVDMVAAALRDNGLAAEDLILEITESAMSEHVGVVPTLRTLRRLGVALALDDFGTGYSSLDRLRHSPVQTVKIDRSFIQGIGQLDDDGILTTAALALAHGLGMEVIAEGVETAEQLSFLRSRGCGAVQGFLFSRPVAPERIASLQASPAWKPEPIGREGLLVAGLG